jgi:hypothetical protein
MTLMFNRIWIKKTTEVLVSRVRKLPLVVAEEAVVCVP